MQLYIGNLSPDVDETLLFELLSHMAPVKSVRMPKHKTKPGHQGFGFATFATKADADYVLRLADSTPIQLCGRPLRVSTAAHTATAQKPVKKTSNPGFGLFVGNLDPQLVTPSAVKVPFAHFGEISSIETDGSHAIVRFSNRESAETAKRELNGTLLLNGYCRIEDER